MHLQERSELQQKTRYLLDVGVILIIALTVRLIQLDRTPKTDEIYHLLAVRSLLADGTLVIGEGMEYSRARAFTYLTAGMVRLFGESLVVGRIIPMLAGVALVVVWFLWLRAVAGRGPAWIAALLLALSPAAIHLSQFTRFYTLHALLVFAGAVCVYHLCASNHSRTRVLALALGAVLAFGMALHLQPTAYVALAGVVLFAMVARGGDLLRWLFAHRRPWLVVGACAAIGLAAYFLVPWPTIIARFWRLATLADTWAEEGRGDFLFYHALFLGHYATFWTLFPLAALVAIASRPKPALFSLCVFGTALVIHSLAAWKGERYVFYALPFFFSIVGIAGAELIRAGLIRAQQAVRWLAGGRTTPRVDRIAAVLLVAAALAFAGIGNTAFTYTRHMLTVSDADWSLPMRYRGEPDWSAAAASLGILARESELVLTSSPGPEPLYFIGRADVLLRPVRGAGDFDVVRIGAYVVSTPEALQQVIDCHSSGLVIIEDKRWRTSHGITPELADHLEAHTEPVPLSGRWRMSAFRWRTASLERDGCAELPQLSGRSE